MGLGVEQWAQSDDVFVLRLSSAIPAVLAVAFCYRVGCDWFRSRWVGLTAAVFLATTGIFVYYARELRMYTLLVLLALATCYCNDLYREAARKNIIVKSIQVEVSGEFDPAPGSYAENVTYTATVEAEASEAEILDLMRPTDTVAEIQNTLRRITSVQLEAPRAISLQS